MTHTHTHVCIATHYMHRQHPLKTTKCQGSTQLYQATLPLLVDRELAAGSLRPKQVLKNATSHPDLLYFRVPPNRCSSAALWWLLCVEKQRQYDRKRGMAKDKRPRGFPCPQGSCLFHGTDGHLRAMPFMPQGNPGDLRSLASLQEADKAEGFVPRTG